MKAGRQALHVALMAVGASLASQSGAVALGGDGERTGRQGRTRKWEGAAAWHAPCSALVYCA